MIPEGRAVLITTTLSSDGRTGAVIAALEREALIGRRTLNAKALAGLCRFKFSTPSDDGNREPIPPIAEIGEV
jgi:hypothetical protein